MTDTERNVLDKYIGYRWKVIHRYDFDRYDVFCIRDSAIHSSEPTKYQSYYLNSDGDWIEYPEGTHIEPVVSISGKVEHVVRQATQIDPHQIEDSIFDIFMKWIMLFKDAEDKRMGEESGVSEGKLSGGDDNVDSSETSSDSVSDTLSRGD